MFDCIKKWFFKRDIAAISNVKLKEPFAKPNVLSYDKVGILYEADGSNNTAIDNFVKALKTANQSTVTTLAYSNENVSKEGGESGVYYKNQFNWYGIPKSSEIDNFTTVKFDVLFLLTTTFPSHFQYIIAKSAAKFKVGQNFEKGTQFLDLIIDTDSKSNVAILVQNIIKVINKIATQK